MEAIYINKRLLAGAMLVLCLFLTGCTSSDVVEQEIVEQDTIEARFIRHRIDSEYSILEDKVSGVCYLEYYYKIGYASVCGITVMLNPDGTPKIWGD